VVEQRLDDGWSYGAEAMDEPVAVDRADQFALDVAGGVETRLGAGLDLEIQSIDRASSFVSVTTITNGNPGPNVSGGPMSAVPFRLRRNSVKVDPISASD